MTLPILALRGALRARCLADAALASAMGGTARIFDEPPRAELPVYAVFGTTKQSDASAGGWPGHEQELTLAVWAAPGSAASALLAAARLAELLDDAPLVLAGHRLVSLAVLSIESGRDPETGLTRVELRLRAVTEVTA